MRSILLLACCAVGLATVQIARLPAERLWTVDDGNKYLLTRVIAAGAWKRPELPYPGRTLDPDLRWAPIRPPFAHVWHRRLVSVFPPGFPLLSAVAYRTVGPIGLYVLPLLAGVLVLFGTAALAREVGAPPLLAAALAGPLSFLFFYWTVFWEHTLGTGLIAWGVVALVRARRDPATRNLVTAGLCFAAATAMRDEQLVTFMAAALTCLADPRLRRSVPMFGIGYLAGWVPLALWRTLLTGSPVGAHDPSDVRPMSWPHVHELPAVLTGVLQTLYGLGLAAHPRLDVSLLLVAGPVATLLALALASRWLGRWPAVGPVMLGVAASASLLALALLSQRPAPAYSLIRVSALTVFAPWVVLLGPAFWRVARAAGSGAADPDPAAGPVRWLAGFGALTVSGLCVVLTPTGAAGIHWGPRHLTTLIPPLAAMAALGATRLLGATHARAGPQWKTATYAGLTGLLAVAFLVQLQGFRMQQRVAAALATVAEAARQSESTSLVTQLWWYAQVTAPVALNRPMYWIDSRQDLETWLVRYAEHGGRRFDWASQRPLEHVVEGLPIRILSVGTVHADGLRPLDHQLVTFELLRPDSSIEAVGEAWRRLGAIVHADGSLSRERPAH